jgi:hypothetical protein
VGGAIGGPKLEGEVVRDGAAATSPTVGGETRGAGRKTDNWRSCTPVNARCVSRVLIYVNV